MPRVAVVFTGGTISMRHDPVAGGNVPVLGGAALLATVPGLDAIADLVPIDRGLTPASHFTFEALFGIADAVRDALRATRRSTGRSSSRAPTRSRRRRSSSTCSTHGPKPIVVTGAMRSASAADYDGPANLTAAVRVAASPGVAAPTSARSSSSTARSRRPTT